MRRAVAAAGLQALMAGTGSSNRPTLVHYRRHHTTPSNHNDPSGSGASPSQAALAALLDAKSQRLAELHAIQQKCLAQAHRYPDRHLYAIFGFLVVQAAVLFDWVYIHFDWNLVEPITYLVSYAATWIALAWYGTLQEEFTLDSLRQKLERQRATALYAARGLDMVEVKRLEVEVARLRRVVHSATPAQSRDAH